MYVLRLTIAALAAAICSSTVGHVDAPTRLLSYLHSRGEARHLDISAPSPIKAIYIDWREVNWALPAQNIVEIVNAGFNLIIMCFYLSGSGPTDMLQAWESVDNATRASTIAYAHAHGAVVLASLGGATDEPYTKPAATLGAAAAQWALDYNLDGLDFDMENVAPGFVFSPLTAPQLVQWLVDATLAARGVLGTGAAGGLITHAPQAPYFGAIGGGPHSNTWVGDSGGYTAVWKGTNGAIDWFNTQFYDQGPTCYTSYTSLFLAANGTGTGTGSCAVFPYTSVAEISGFSVPLGALVVGKPLEVNDAGSGWVNATALGAWVAQAGGKASSGGLGWRTGVMAWSWEKAAAPAWLQAIYPGTNATTAPAL